MTGQVDRLWHASNLYYVEPAVRLAEELVDATFAERVFFCNSGAEANEAAVKVVRKHASAAGRGRKSARSSPLRARSTAAPWRR